MTPSLFLLFVYSASSYDHIVEAMADCTIDADSWFSTKSRKKRHDSLTLLGSHSNEFSTSGELFSSGGFAVSFPGPRQSLACCGCLSEKSHHRLKYLSAWSVAGGTVWEELEVMAVLEEVCHKG